MLRYFQSNIIMDWSLSLGLHFLVMGIAIIAVQAFPKDITIQTIPVTFEIITEQRQALVPKTHSLSTTAPPKSTPQQKIAPASPAPAKPAPPAPRVQPAKVQPAPVTPPTLHAPKLVKNKPEDTAKKQPAIKPIAQNIKPAETLQDNNSKKQKPIPVQQQLASILKSVERNLDATAPSDVQQKTKNAKTEQHIDDNDVLKKLRERFQDNTPDNTQNHTGDIIADQLSASEIDLLKKQIASCWNIPAGARESELLQIRIRIKVNVDRSVHSADIVEKNRLQDPFYRTAAESALRAVLHPNCSPLNLPKDKYELWNDIIFTFDPSIIIS